MYNPSLFSTPLLLLKPVVTKAYGVNKKSYSLEAGEPINGSFKSYGGTDRDVNGVYSIEDTATVETWYRPDITSDCAVCVRATGAIYEIIGEPENIEMRNQYLVFKVRRYKGGA